MKTHLIIMRNITILFFCLLNFTLFAQPQYPNWKPCSDVSCSMDSIQHFIQKNISYPTLALEKNVEGVVMVGFTVAKNGQPKDMRIVKGIGFGCDDEAKRLVAMMKKWNTEQHKEVVLPIAFNLDENNSNQYVFKWGEQYQDWLSVSSLEKLSKQNFSITNANEKDLKINELYLVYENGSKSKEYYSPRGIVEPKAKKMLSKMKAGGTLMVVAFVSDNFEEKEITRIFSIVE